MSTPVQNPFDIQRVILENSIYLSATPQYLIQVHILQGLLAIILLFQILILIVRWKNKTFWLFRTAPSSNSSGYRFLVPNSIILFTIFYIIFSGCLQGFLVSLENYGTTGSNLHNVMLWRCLTYFPLWMAANMMTWSVFLSPILANQTYGGNLSFWSRNPLLVNGFFISLPFIFLASFLPYMIPLNNAFNQIFDCYNVLHALLVKASFQLKNGITIDPADLVLMQELSYEIQRLTPIVVHYWSSEFIIYSTYIGFIGVIFTFSAVRHFRSIGNAMSTIKSRMSSKSNSTRTDYGQQMNNLADSYRALVFTSVIVAIMCTAYFALNVTIAAKTSDIIKGGAFAEAVIFLPLYLWFVWGGISTFSIFLVSIKSGSALTGKINSASGITISNPAGSRSDQFGSRSGGSNPLIFSQSLSQTVEMEMEGESLGNDRKNFVAYDVQLRPTRNETWDEKDQPFIAV